MCFGAFQDSLIAKPNPPIPPYLFNQKMKKRPLKKETTHAFFGATFCSKFTFSSLKKPSKIAQKIIPKKSLHDPKLNSNLNFRNTPFLTTFLTQKSITGINIWLGLILNTFMWFLYYFKLLIKIPLFRNLKIIICQNIILPLPGNQWRGMTPRKSHWCCTKRLDNRRRLNWLC